MTMQNFIRAEIDPIVDEWEAFARTCVPAAKGLDPHDLRDHARVMLMTFADDMDQLQNEGERSEKSVGDLQRNSPALSQAGRAHAEQRFAQGFTVTQMVSEYRALRAAVVSRWTATLKVVDAKILDEVVRFGEAIDQAITESVVVHMKEVEESRNLLLGVLGHDLRNPLGAVRMSAEYLLRTHGLDENQTKAANRIVNSSLTIMKMADDLLDYTQTMLARELPLKVEASNMGDICREVADELSAFHPDRTIHISQEGDINGDWDRARLKQLLSNLAANAIQHGSAVRPVTISLTSEHDTVTCKVHNEGMPISENARAPLFKPAITTTTQRCPTLAGGSGLGLGLYIAHEIVIAHKGELELESNEKDGTTFTFCLPRKVGSIKPDTA